jgi:hypothetical protein
MGTFHAFISQPLIRKEDAEDLLNDLKKYCDDRDEAYITTARGHFLVVGVVKNLGGPPFELNGITSHDWATVSDEKNFLNSSD